MIVVRHVDDDKLKMANEELLMISNQKRHGLSLSKPSIRSLVEFEYFIKVVPR